MKLEHSDLSPSPPKQSRGTGFAVLRAFGVGMGPNIFPHKVNFFWWSLVGCQDLTKASALPICVKINRKNKLRDWCLLG